MSMMKWTPLEEMELLRKQLDSMFAPVSSLSEGNAQGFGLPVEVLESENQFRVRFILPGLPADNIGEHVNIEATAKTLTVSGELAQGSLNPGEKMLIDQFRYGKFYKQLSFPDGIDHENIQADYVNGILEVGLPKAAAQQKRSVQINVKR